MLSLSKLDRTKSHFIAMAALFVLLLFVPDQSWAAHPCPGGPGPGERQVAVGGGSPGVAAYPICERFDNAPQAPATVSYYNIYGAIAAHPDADDVWMAGNYNGPNSAEQEALAMCRAAMGAGCISFGEWHNSSFSVIRNSQGVLFGAWNGQGGQMRKNVLRDCGSNQQLPCEVIGSFSSSKRRYAPALATARKSYAVAAWVFGEGYDGRLYVSTGRTVLADAEREALTACNKATGKECKIATSTGNGLIQTFTLANGDSSVVVESNPKRAQQAVKAHCKKLKQSCTLQRAYDSKASGLTVHSFILTDPIDGKAK